MAKTKEIKNYEIKVADGRLTFQMTKKSADGIYHSLSIPYPYTIVNYNTKRGQTEIIKLTRKQTEQYCLDHARKNGWLELKADGK